MGKLNKGLNGSPFSSVVLRGNECISSSYGSVSQEGLYLTFFIFPHISIANIFNKRLFLLTLPYACWWWLNTASSVLLLLKSINHILDERER